ncbi:RNA ligase family protein [Streptosporangium sp. NPDC020072]|uniref:RNA ligase family protein n=1 Tax=Streptosporangium sp. NPDC020072 TaxID=3154788 RepID=UPI00343AF71B
MAEFKKFDPIPRLSKRWIFISEKIDGTNGCVVVDHDGAVLAQSRNRFVTPEDDNFGFARWVYQNAESLAGTLGPGHHYGEWWGVGIQRGYDLIERRFSLFNTRRWGEQFENAPPGVPGLGVVPLLYEGVWDEHFIDRRMEDLAQYGSQAALSYMNPEGIVVFDTLTGQFYKRTFGSDDHKGKSS